MAAKAHKSNAVMLTYLSAALSGEVNPFWPHLLLISASVIAGIAVGAGIVMESPEYTASVHRVAKWLVIVGVVVESFCSVGLFVFDEGISARQQDTIISLEERLAPRRLSDAQRLNITKRISPFSVHAVVVGAVPPSAQNATLGREIVSALTDAHIDAFFNQAGVAAEFGVAGSTGRLEGLSAVRDGVNIWVMTGNQRSQQFAEALARALNDERISALARDGFREEWVKFRMKSDGIDRNNETFESITIAVGDKP